MLFYSKNPKRRRDKLVKGQLKASPRPLPTPPQAPSPPINVENLPPPYSSISHSVHPLSSAPIPVPTSFTNPYSCKPLSHVQSSASPALSWPEAAHEEHHDHLIQTATSSLHDKINGISRDHQKDVHYPNHKPAVCDLISTKFCSVITSIDSEIFSGDEQELVVYQAPDPVIRGGWGFANRDISRAANNVVSSAVTSPKGTNYFAKASQYANSRLPPNLPSLKLYMPSYPLICLAAKYSQRVYVKPTGKEREAHIDADWRSGTKAMVIKSIPIDDINTIVFAIRGSQTFMDWAVNLNTAPKSPVDFLDDPGNLCHAGFLSAARKMIKPVAARLRSLLEEDPSRTSSSLIMSGHSAGGAVASLLYAHMMAEDVKSELNILTGCFKRIHCITFGAPPISLLPLGKPKNPRYQKSLFLSFINEGDPVPRADKAYVRSLLDLFATPAPGSNCISNLIPSVSPQKFGFIPLARPRPTRATSAPPLPAPAWKVPPGTLSNAGRLVILRVGVSGADDDVKAVVASDEQLREVVFGDPVMHMMSVYAKRVEVLATRAVTAQIWS